jgi:hypothetical protein
MDGILSESEEVPGEIQPSGDEMIEIKGDILVSF